MVPNFAIVKFTQEDDALGIVALKWVSYDDSWTFYPNVTTNEKRDKIIRLQVEPGKEWLKCPIQIMHKYGKISFLVNSF